MKPVLFLLLSIISGVCGEGDTRVVKKGAYLGNMLFRRYYRNSRRLRDPAAGKAREHPRALAKKLGLNPDRWFQHVEVAAGRITGRETVRYVANIYKYYLAYRLMKDLGGKHKLKTARRIAKPNPKRIE